MNILIGKLGKVVKFKNLQIATGGDTSLILFSTMSRMFPEHNFYFFAPNDLSKLSNEEYEYLFPNKNVFSVHQDPKIIGYAKGVEKSDNALFSFQPTVDYINSCGLKFDFAIIFNGYVGSHVLCECIEKLDGTGCRLVMNAFKRYAGPYVHVLNSLNVPLYTMAEDPRYIVISAQDLFNRERIVLTQMTDRVFDSRVKHIKSYEDHSWVVTAPTKCCYADIEKIFLMGINPKWREIIDIDRKLNNTTNPKCIILSNGHGTNSLDSGTTIPNGRFAGYKEYVLDGLKNTEYKDTHIFGKWKETSDTVKYPQIQEKMICDLDNEIADAKYTLVYSIIKGFVTIKPYEMIVKGLIPFIHPDYDPDRLLKLPEYLYVKDPSDFANKMRELDSDNDKYIKLLNECFDCIKPEYTDGSYVVNKIMRIIFNDMQLNYEDRAGVPSILDHFAKNIFDYESVANSTTNN